MREPVSGHEVVKKKKDCNNLEKETVGLEKVKVIARIHTDFPTKFGIPRQSGLSDATGLVVFEPEFRQPDALRGIEEYTHLWLLWGFSEVRQESGTWKATVRPPRLGGNERVGVFACRSPYRPNPIGLSCVKLERIISHEKYGMCLLVSGVDMMDQTPIYDIKPYLAFADSHPDALGGFTDQTRKYGLSVEIPEMLLERIQEKKRESLKAVLAHDPRPSYQDDPERVYGMEFAGYEIKFMVEKGILRVTDIELR